MKNQSTIGLPMIVFLIFLVLKLTKTIAWSWWWVTAPLWGSAILGVLLVIILMIATIANAMKGSKHRKFNP